MLNASPQPGIRGVVKDLYKVVWGELGGGGAGGRVGGGREVALAGASRLPVCFLLSFIAVRIGFAHKQESKA